MISLTHMKFTKETEELVLKVLREGAVGQSVYIEQFEAALCTFTGSKYAVAVSSGSMADTVLLAAMKEIYHCHQVIIPALTFIAQPNAARINGLEVIFCDVLDDMLLDNTEIENIVTDDNPAILFTTDLLGRAVIIEEMPVRQWVQIMWGKKVWLIPFPFILRIYWELGREEQYLPITFV